LKRTRPFSIGTFLNITIRMIFIDGTVDETNKTPYKSCNK
jgi:hypothetical protein